MHRWRDGHRHGGRRLTTDYEPQITQITQINPGRVRITPAVESAILAHAQQAAPQECCGLLIGTADTIVEAVSVRNRAESPHTRYEIDPREHLQAIRSARARGLQVVGAYHSHPRSAAVPSATDAAEGFGDFLFLIVGLMPAPEVTAWAWAGGNFTPLSLVRLPEGMG